MALDMNIAALGRPFTLGMLYDARTDKLIPGLTLWDGETLQKNTVSKFQRNSTFKISSSDTMESKSSLLDVEASLKASFLSGMVEVGGSAKYLNDTKKSKNQSRVMLQYNVTTNFKQIRINNISMETNQIAVIERSTATHIVTGILYGANAVFVFDGQKMDARSVQNIQGSMEAAMNKVSTAVEAKVSVKLNTEEEEVDKKFTCKFYGDVILDRNPSTFEDALKTYAELPKLLGENGERSVPLKVWLTPLRNLNPNAPELKTEISPRLMMKVQNALEDLREIDMRCNNSLNNNVVKNFTQVRKELTKFKQLCDTYTTKLKNTMAKKLPSIREGKEDERSLEELFDDRDETPFSHEKLTEWLNHKEVEISIIKSCVEVSGELKFVRNQSELMKEAVGVEDALCFVFTSLETGDPCLDVMAEYFDSPTVHSAHEHPWYYSSEVLTNMKEKGKAFQDLAKALKNHKQFCFLVAAIENKKYKGATIYHYNNGGLVTEDFSKPDLPPVKTITDRRDLIWYATDLTLDPNTANGYLNLSNRDKKATCGDWQCYPDNPERFDDHPQVLCKEGLEGRHYWEVEWGPGDDESVYVGVVYKGFQRKDGYGIGSNDISWAFGKQNGLYAYHISKKWSTCFPSGLNRIGVFLDKPAGTLSFYRVSSDTLSHFYTFEDKFTEPLYPALYTYYAGNYAHLHLAE